MVHENGVTEKLVHGSDYPVPPNAFSSLIHLGWPKTMELIDIWSFLERDVKIKRARGFPDAVFTNTARVLGEKALERWGARSSNIKLPLHEIISYPVLVNLTTLLDPHSRVHISSLIKTHDLHHFTTGKTSAGRTRVIKIGRRRSCPSLKVKTIRFRSRPKIRPVLRM